MKNCNECQNFKKEVCTKNKKNGYNNCKTYKAIPIEELKKELKNLQVTGSDEARITHLEAKIRTFEGY